MRFRSQILRGKDGEKPHRVRLFCCRRLMVSRLRRLIEPTQSCPLSLLKWASTTLRSGNLCPIDHTQWESARKCDRHFYSHDWQGQDDRQ